MKKQSVYAIIFLGALECANIPFLYGMETVQDVHVKAMVKALNAGDIAIIERALKIKGEIEKIREQVQNIE